MFRCGREPYSMSGNETRQAGLAPGHLRKTANEIGSTGEITENIRQAPHVELLGRSLHLSCERARAEWSSGFGAEEGGSLAGKDAAIVSSSAASRISRS